jgi:ABC-2 type transport system permease protein
VDIKIKINFVTAILKKSVLEYIRYPANFHFFTDHAVVYILPYYFLMESFSPGGTSQGLAEWTGSANFSSFLMIGLVVSFVIMKIFWGMGFMLKRLMDIGMLETIWVYPLSRVGYILAESLFNALQLICEALMVTLVIRVVFKFNLPPALLGQLIWLIPFLLMIYGLGLSFAALVLLLKNANMLVDTGSFLTQTITGTMNPVQAMPKFFIAIAMALPITYFIDYFRATSLGIIPLIPLAMEKVILIVSALVFPILGAWVFTLVDRHCRRVGNLGVH